MPRRSRYAVLSCALSSHAAKHPSDQDHSHLVDYLHLLYEISASAAHNTGVLDGNASERIVTTGSCIAGSGRSTFSVNLLQSGIVNESSEDRGSVVLSSLSSHIQALVHHHLDTMLQHLCNRGSCDGHSNDKAKRTRKDMGSNEMCELSELLYLQFDLCR